MIELTMQAALLLYSACFVLGFIIMYLYSRHIETDENIRYFLSFFFLSAVGSLLMFLRVEINNLFISVIVANSLIILANLILGIGVIKLIGQTYNTHLMTITYTVFVTLFMIFTYVDNNPLIRSVVFNIIVSIILLRIVYHIIKAKKSKEFGDELMSPILIIDVVMILLRTVSLFLFRETSNDFLAFQRDSFSIAILGIINIFILVGLLSMINSKIQSYLMESERSKSSLLSNLPGFASAGRET